MSDYTRLGDKHDACAILKCGETHLWKLQREGVITPVRITRKMVRYDLREISALADRLIADAKQKAAARRAEPARLAA
jgi:hypothetical protein